LRGGGAWEHWNGRAARLEAVRGRANEVASRSGACGGACGGLALLLDAGSLTGVVEEGAGRVGLALSLAQGSGAGAGGLVSAASVHGLAGIRGRIPAACAGAAVLASRLVSAEAVAGLGVAADAVG